jgi:hypothetical protein
VKRIAIIITFILMRAIAPAQTITVVPKPAETRVDIMIDGKLFTSYRWDEKIKRPVLFPIMSAGSNFVTRGFPIETRDDETINHPHQVGSSLVYGDVNGIDFWNNSPFRNTEELKRMGRIDLKEVIRTKSGERRGELVTRSDWVHPNGKTMLEETTKLTFNTDGRKRWIDRETVLKAVGEDVVFGDNKEGFFAVHLNVGLQQDDQFPVKVTSAGGVISERKTSNGLTGKYFTSEGIAGNALWGTPAKWAAVTGAIEGEKITVAVFDHPENLNFPSNMMVRPYGLLALNPYGQKAFVPTKVERKFTLAAGKSVLFKHRLAVFPKVAEKAVIDAEYQRFINVR